jgi:hypothetical protein
MARAPDSETWRLQQKDPYGRTVTLKRDGAKYVLEIEPSSQRDEGERMYSLTAAIIQELGEIVSRK